MHHLEDDRDRAANAVTASHPGWSAAAPMRGARAWVAAARAESCRSALLPAVPDVVVRARADGRPRLVVRALILATSACRRERLHGLGWIAGRHALDAAEDPVDAAWARYRLAMTALHVGDLDETRALLDFGPLGGSADAVAISGAAAQVDAVAAIRGGSRREAEEALRDAAVAAEQVGDGNLLWTGFGPSNVALNRAAVALEDLRPGDAAEALRAVRPERLASRERRYTHRLTLAHAAEQLRHTEDAVRHLLAAEQVDADALAHDVLGRELVAAMLRRKPRPPAGLRALATRLQVAE